MQNIDMWIPIDLRVNELSPQTRWLTVYARLKQGVTLEQAQAEMDGFDDGVGAAFLLRSGSPSDHGGSG